MFPWKIFSDKNWPVLPLRPKFWKNGLRGSTGQFLSKNIFHWNIYSSTQIFVLILNMTFILCANQVMMVKPAKYRANLARFDGSAHYGDKKWPSAGFFLGLFNTILQLFECSIHGEKIALVLRKIRWQQPLH